MPKLILRIDLGRAGRIGPGKIALLEAIAEHGSISAAGRALGMSYRRAWDLVEESNGIFGDAVAARQVGGRKGGAATLTPLGQDLVRRFRSIERATAIAARDDLQALQEAVRETTSPHAGGASLAVDETPLGAEETTLGAEKTTPGT